MIGATNNGQFPLCCSDGARIWQWQSRTPLDSPCVLLVPCIDILVRGCLELCGLFTKFVNIEKQISPMPVVGKLRVVRAILAEGSC